MHTNTPNMLASISTVVAAENINIENMLNRSRGEFAYTIIEISGSVPENIEDELKKVSALFV